LLSTQKIWLSQHEYGVHDFQKNIINQHPNITPRHQKTLPHVRELL